MPFYIGILRKRLLLNSLKSFNIISSASQNNHIYHLFSTNKFSQNEDTALNTSQKLNVSEQSVLEQIFLKKEQGPQTTAEKGNFYN